MASKLIKTIKSICKFGLIFSTDFANCVGIYAKTLIIKTTTEPSSLYRCLGVLANLAVKLSSVSYNKRNYSRLVLKNVEKNSCRPTERIYFRNEVDKPKIINVFAGEYPSVYFEGLSVSAVISNSTDKFCQIEENASQLEGITTQELELVYNYSMLQRTRELTSPQLQDTKSIDLCFQALGLLCGCVLGKSLWTGKTIVSKHSFVVQLDHTQQPYVFYLFEDFCPWYLMVGTFKGTKNYIYLPSKNILMLLRPIESEWYSVYDYVSGFNKLVSARSDLFYHYCSRPTVPALYSGGLQNLGHFLWNEIQAIHNLVDAGFHLNLNTVLYKHQYMDIQSMFPGYFEDVIFRPCSTDEVFYGIAERGWFSVHPTAFYMNSACAARIKESAIKLASFELFPIVFSKAFGLKIWFNLRAHNKIWVNQVDGLVALTEYCLTLESKILVILDGLPDCKDLVRQARSKISEGVEILDGTGVSLSDSIMMASAVDFYVTTIGSGLVINTWITEKPGIAHSEKSHLGQITMWKEVRPDVPAPLVPKSSHVVEFGSGAYCNYFIDPIVIVDLFKQLRAGPAF